MALTSRRAIIRFSRLKLLFALSEGGQNRFLKHRAVQRNLCYGIDIFVVSNERNSGSKGKSFGYMIMMFFIEIGFRK